jgi:hypothetical protein
LKAQGFPAADTFKKTLCGITMSNLTINHDSDITHHDVKAALITTSTAGDCCNAHPGMHLGSEVRFIAEEQKMVDKKIEELKKSKGKLGGLKKIKFCK